MSRVYLARDQKMDCHVVIKEMQVLEATPEELDYFQKRFHTEAKLLFRLSCRGIPKVTDFFSEEGANYLVMEYIEGEDLFAFLEKRPDRRISVGEFVDWMWQLLETLSFLHSQDPIIIHRDIKPTNIMLTPQGKVILVDFGLATSLEGDNRTQTTIGTFGYASPEHYMGKLTTSSDIFSLGASFHFLLTGQEPAQRVPFDYPPISSYRDDVNEGIDYIISRMVEREENSRYQSAREVLEDLRKLTDYLNEPDEYETMPVFSPSRENNQEKQYLLGDSASGDSYYSGIKMTAGGNKKDQEKPVPDNYKDSRKEPENPSARMFLDPADEFSDDEDRKTFSGFLERFKEKIDQIKPPAVKLTPKLIIPVVILLVLLTGFFLMAGRKPGTVPPPPGEGLPEQGVDTAKILRESLKAGLHYMEEEKFDLAIKEFGRAVELDENNTEALMGRGRAFFEVKDYSGAFDDFSRVINLEQENHDAYWMRSRVHIARGAHQQARKDLDWLIEKTRRNDAAPYYYQRALTFYSQNQIEDAIRDLRVYLDIEKNRKDDRDEIQYIKAQKQLSGLLRAQAEEALKVKDFPLALRILNEAIMYDPDSEGNYFMTGQVYAAMEDVDKAIAQFEKALGQNPESPRTRRDLSRLYYQRGIHFVKTDKPRDAEEDFKAALKISPSFRAVSRELADLYNKSGIKSFNQQNFKEALEYFDKSIELEGNVAETLYNRGFTHYSLGYRQQAEADFKKALRLDPRSELASRIPGEIDPRKGLGPSPHNIKNTPQPPPVDHSPPGPGQKYAILMNAHKELQEGRYMETIRMADQVLSLDSSSPEAYVLKAEALAHTDRIPGAIQNFRSALQHAPEDGKLYRHAKSRLEELSRRGGPPIPRIEP